MNDAAYEAAVEAELAAMRRYVQLHGRLPGESAPPAPAPAAPSPAYSPARPEPVPAARPRGGADVVSAGEQWDVHPFGGAPRRQRAERSSVSDVPPVTYGGSVDVPAPRHRARQPDALAEAPWRGGGPANETKGATDIKSKQQAYAAVLEAQAAEQRARRERERADRSAPIAATPPWLLGSENPKPARPTTAVDEPLVKHTSPPLAPPGGATDDAAPALHRRPSRYRDMSVGLIAAVDAVPSTAAPQVAVAEPLAAVPARRASAGSPLSMPANMGAEAVSNAIKAGHTFTRYRFDRLPEEERERLAAAHRAREAQAAELEAQIAERRAAKAREQQEAAAAAAAEEERFARERDALRQREMYEVEHDRSVVPAAGRGHAPKDGPVQDATASGAADAVPPSQRHYPHTRERLLALRHGRPLAEGVADGAPASVEDVVHARSINDSAAAAQRDLDHEYAAFLQRNVRSMAQAAAPSPPRAAPPGAHVHDAAGASPQHNGAHGTSPLQAIANSVHGSAGFPPAVSHAAPPATAWAQPAPSTPAVQSFVPNALIHRMRYALAELEAAAAAVPLVNAGLMPPPAMWPMPHAGHAAAPPAMHQPPSIYGRISPMQPQAQLPTDPFAGSYHSASLAALQDEREASGLLDAQPRLVTGGPSGDLTWVGSDRPRTAMPGDVTSASRPMLRGKWAQSFEGMLHSFGATNAAHSADDVVGAAPPRQGASAAAMEQSLDSSTLLVYLDGIRPGTASAASRLPTLNEHGDDTHAVDTQHTDVGGAPVAATETDVHPSDQYILEPEPAPEAVDKVPDETAIASDRAADDAGAAGYEQTSHVPAATEPESGATVESVQRIVAANSIEPDHGEPASGAAANSRMSQSPTAYDEDAFEDDADASPAPAQSALISSWRPATASSIAAGERQPHGDVTALMHDEQARKPAADAGQSLVGTNAASPTKPTQSAPLTSPKSISFAEIQAALDGFAPDTDAMPAPQSGPTPVVQSRPASAHVSTAGRLEHATDDGRKHAVTARAPTRDDAELDASSRQARRTSWGLGDTVVDLHKRRLLAFYTLHAPPKAHKENVDAAWQLFGPRIWDELERKYKGKTSGFRPSSRPPSAAPASPELSDLF